MIGAALNSRRARGIVFETALFMLSFAAFCVFMVVSGNLERFMEGKNLLALLEILLVCVLLFSGVFLWGRDDVRKRIFTVGLVTLSELYLHRMILPFFLSGLYFLLCAVPFLMLFGLFGQDPVGFLRKGMRDMAVLFSGSRSGNLPLRAGERICSTGSSPYRNSEREKSTLTGGRVSLWAASFSPLYLSIPFLLIQLNRMNIAADYDSLRYGLRSDFILFPGNGLWEKAASFFTSSGQINAVYMYPKGLELLTLPLASFHSFALLFMFQFWTMLSCMALVYLIVFQVIGIRRNAAWAAAILPMLSSVGNMSITAKTDMMTLCLQLLMILLFLKGDPVRGTAAAILSLSFKPTAVVFSGMACGTLLFLIMWTWLCRRLFRGESDSGSGMKPERKDFPALLFSLFFTGLITFRTYYITGLPLSTTFTAFFKLLGIREKWPFNFKAYLDYGSSQGVMAGMASFFRRILLFLFCPVGEDMAHVAIAWGGVLVPLLLWRSFGVTGKVLRGRMRAQGEGAGEAALGHDDNLLLQDGGRQAAGFLEREEMSVAALVVLFLAMTAGSMLTFYFLWQVDGNYYILWNSLLLILACTALDTAEFFQKPRMLLLFSCALLTTIITSWAGATGFTEIDFLNRGYYDNEAKMRELAMEKGTYDAYLLFSREPSTGVLAFADTPECYMIPCRIQSISDVEGSGGSPGLYDDLIYFEWFLKWAGTDYIYIEKGFLPRLEEERAREMLLSLAEDGILLEPRTDRGDGRGAEGSGESPYLVFSLDQERLQIVWDEKTPPPASEENIRRALDALEDFV